MRTIEDTISTAIKMQLEKVEVARDFLIDDFEGNLERLLFIWDYIWTKRPREIDFASYMQAEQSRKANFREYGWIFYHFDLYTVYCGDRKNEIFSGLLDCPIKNCFDLFKTDNPERLNGWNSSRSCFYVNRMFVRCCSRRYPSIQDAYYGAIYNWYKHGLYTDDIK